MVAGNRGGRPSNMKQAAATARKEVDTGKQKAITGFFTRNVAAPFVAAAAAAPATNSEPPPPAPASPQSSVIDLVGESVDSEAEVKAVPDAVAAALEDLPAMQRNYRAYTVEVKMAALRVLEACGGKYATAVKRQHIINDNQNHHTGIVNHRHLLAALTCFLSCNLSRGDLLLIWCL